METGSWMCLSRVDFGEGAIGFTARVSGTGLIAVTSKNPGKWGTYITVAEVNSRGYTDITVPLWSITKGVVQKLFIVAQGNVSIESWSFIKK
jgi:hypothetical protein